MSWSRDGMPRQRAVSLISHSSKADGVAEDESGTPHETVKHCLDEELEKIDGPPRKKDVCCKESCSLTNSEVITKVRWSKEEDEILTQMVNKHGPKNWQTVAHAILGRSAQQCRVRWAYSLDPAINKEAWSQQEELRLIRAHEIYGNKWREMVKHFPGRTNCAIKDYWRGPMKRKLGPYLASGLLKQCPDLSENLSIPQNSDSDTRKDSEGPSDRNQRLPALPTSSKSKLEPTDLGKNADTSEGGSSDIMYSKGPDAHSDKASEKIMAKSEQRAITRRRLDFLSSPVELKVSSGAVNSQRPLQNRKQMSPTNGTISPSNVCQDISPEVPSECANKTSSPDGSYQPNDVHFAGILDPCSPELNEADFSFLMEMSYIDSLMISPPGSPHDGNSI